MASRSQLAHGAEAVRDRVESILKRAEATEPGTPASDAARDTLRDLWRALDAYDLRAIDFTNAARQAGK